MNLKYCFQQIGWEDENIFLSWNFNLYILHTGVDKSPIIGQQRVIKFIHIV
jgi:hypothetical protein